MSDMTDQEILDERAQAAKEIFEGAPPMRVAADPEITLPPQAGEPVDEDSQLFPDDHDGDQGDDADAKKDDSIAETLLAMNSRLESLNRIEERLKQSEQRIGSISNDLYNARKAKEEADEAAKNAPTPEEEAAAKKADEEWEELKAADPDMARAVEGRIARNKAPDVSGIKEEVGSVKESVAKMQGGMISRADLQRELVSFVHPDWMDTIKSSDYKEWLLTQPPNVQEVAAKSQMAKDAVAILNAFSSYKRSKKSPEEIQAARDKRLQIAGVSTPGAKIVTPKSDNDLTLQEIRNQEAKKIWDDL